MTLKVKKDKKNAGSEYKALAKMGFICLEEVDEEEAKELLVKAGKSSEPPKKREKKAKKEAKASAIAPDTAALTEIPVVSIPGWKDLLLGVHPLIIKAMIENGFDKPTEIQQRVLETLATSAKKDILGSAPTGSGKTLAFLLPILKTVMDCTMDCKNSLIIVPTRELAMQIQSHLEQVTRLLPEHTISSVCLVGGLSQEKQERLLSHSPSIIIATPGRLAELMEGHQFVSSFISNLRYLVLDEADRLVEAGHFRDLDAIIEKMNSSAGDASADNHTKSRQTFLFSATLSPSVEQLRRKIRFNDRKPAIIKIGSDVATPAQAANPTSLQQYRIDCLLEEKNQFLLWLLRTQIKGRVLIFVNTIDLVKSLASLLEILSLPAHPLHAQMQQRQRLKNLERFTSTANSILVTSDVAARGLDLPAVDCVIHYHIPKTSDVFFHRSGRTARAMNSGYSISLVAPHEASLYNRFANGISVKEYPFDAAQIETLRTATNMAQKIQKTEEAQAKASRGSAWERQAAEALGIIPDDEVAGNRKRKHIDDDGEGDHRTKMRKQTIIDMRRQLKGLLANLK